MTSITYDGEYTVTTLDSGHVIREITANIVPSPVTERNITGLAYLRRFTQAQRIAIRDLAKTDAIAQDLMYLLDSTIAQGGQVNLMDQDTINGINYLAAMLPSQNINPAVILA